MDEKNEAIALKIDDKYFNGFVRRGVVFSWNIAGATLFGAWDEAALDTFEKRLKQKGYNTKRIKVGIIENQE